MKTKPLKMPSGECSDKEGMRYKVIVYNVCKGNEKVPTIRSEYKRESKEQALLYAKSALLLAETDKTIQNVQLLEYKRFALSAFDNPDGLDLKTWSFMDLKAL